MSIEPSATADSTLRVGSVGSGLSLTAAELARIDTTSSLRLGGRLTATVVIDDITYGGSASTLEVSAGRDAASLVRFSGSAASSFVGPSSVSVMSRGDV